MKVVSVHRRNRNLTTSEVLKIESLQRRIAAIIETANRRGRLPPRKRLARGPGYRFTAGTVLPGAEHAAALVSVTALEPPGAPSEAPALEAEPVPVTIAPDPPAP